MYSGALCSGMFPPSHFHVLLRAVKTKNTDFPKYYSKRVKQMLFFFTPGMRSATSFTLLTSSTSCIPQRGRASLTAGLMCWDIFSRYKAAVKHPTISAWWQIYPLVSFLQGGAPTPFDRNFGTKLGVRAIQWLSQKMTENFRQGSVAKRTLNRHNPQRSLIYASSTPPDHVFANSPETACMLGFSRKVISFIPVTELKAVTDFEWVKSVFGRSEVIFPRLRLIRVYFSSGTECPRSSGGWNLGQFSKCWPSTRSAFVNTCQERSNMWPDVPSASTPCSRNSSLKTVSSQPLFLQFTHCSSVFTGPKALFSSRSIVSILLSK